MNRAGGFDMPYIIRRTIKLFGDKTNIYKKLSPINVVKCWENHNEPGVYNVTIGGVYTTDYLSLYKWFTTRNMESFKLGYVAKVEELETQKIDWSTKYDTMWEFYKEDWDWFVDYCIDDSEVVKDLEDKLGYMGLAQTLSLYCCTTMNHYNSSVALIEGLMLKYYRRENLCAPRLYGGSQEWFPAAYVKDPIKGIHKDEVDLDITSSYPTHMIVQNMSLETYFGRIIGFHDEDKMGYKTDKGIHEPVHHGRPIYQMIIDYNRDKEYPEFILLNDSGYNKYSGRKLDKFNSALERGLLSISPCGSVFLNKPRGLMAEVVKNTFFERKKQKGLKGEYKRKAEECKNEKEKQIWMERSDNKHALQWAIKIIINSFFGVTGVPYSRYFNVNISEAITSAGRHTIQMGEVFVDDLLNKPDDGLIDIVNEIKVLCSSKN
jgi:DNA polymerase elongation subunit (family B)